MKKYISILLSVIMMISVICVYAENEDTESMSVEVIPVVSENEDVQDISNKDEENIQLNNTETKEEAILYTLNQNLEDGWSEAGVLSEGQADADMLIVNDGLYIVGGYGQSGGICTIKKYDDSTSDWNEITSIPDTINGFSVVSVGEDIYIIGGYANNVYMNNVQIYNTSTGEWRTGTSMIERREGAASLYTDNKIYVFGGRNAKGIVNDYEYYDIVSNTWNKVTSGYDDSLIRIGAKGKYVNGFVCISGGCNKDYEYMGVNLYSSSEMNNMIEITPKGNEYVSVAWGVDKALIFTAKTGNMSDGEILEMIAEDDNPRTVIANIGDYPIRVKCVQNVIYKGYLYCLGGYDTASKKYNDSIYKYSIYYGDFSTGDGTINSTVTADGNAITLNAEVDKDYCLMINANNMSTFDGYTFTIEYQEDAFEIIDGCALTKAFDIDTGSVEDTDIQITDTSHGISFITSEIVPEGEKVSETVNAIRIRAKSSGQRTIKYRMTK